MIYRLTAAILLTLVIACGQKSQDQQDQQDQRGPQEMMETQEELPTSPTKEVAAPSEEVAAAKEMVLQTQGVLQENLVHAITTKGTEGAVSFCSEKAYPLTDSVSEALNATIRRVSDKLRNPDNKPTSAELTVMDKMRLQLGRNEQITPIQMEQGGQTTCYFPIVINAACLQCHGKVGSQIKPSTFNALKELYPADRAYGYNINELRGLWVVEMDAVN